MQSLAAGETFGQKFAGKEVEVNCNEDAQKLSHLDDVLLLKLEIAHLAQGNDNDQNQSQATHERA